MTHEEEREQAKKYIQQRLAEITQVLNEVIVPQARKYKIEFSFLGMQYHLYPRGCSAERPGEDEIYVESLKTYRYEPRQPAQEGLLAADQEWYSSDFGCSSRYWDWHSKNWPERNEP